MTCSVEIRPQVRPPDEIRPQVRPPDTITAKVREAFSVDVCASPLDLTVNWLLNGTQPLTNGAEQLLNGRY